MKPSLLFFLFFLLISLHPFSGCASAYAGTFKAPSSVAFRHSEVNDFEMKAGRKLIGVNGLLLDYEPPGANPAHDPPSGRRGGHP
ncbi:hypothetical protein CDL15_Pgr018061 [Punica granatum]|uniref:Uncharacterized protein n=1 Tax=Punica granatum TaxID=22663 RepID=A0A218WI47_PUNGR|nr:hypothetical protein CDL15_Pgr018061 [Punica granatum]PKI32122.1 hypothetical protein CRG98_047491 [Punica granatum]